MKLIQNNILYLDGVAAGDQAIYDAFSIGFSDYQLPFNMPMTTFIDRFFGIEGNDRTLSYVAYDGETPIAVLLGGLNTYDQLQTLRCGALSVAPTYRGNGVSKALMQLHEQDGIKSSADQLMLEVLGENQRAIHFYEKCDYHKTTILYYYHLTKESFRVGTRLTDSKQPVIPIAEASIDVLMISDAHTNWQNDIHYLAKDDALKIYVVAEGDTILSFIAINTKGKLYRIYTIPTHRGRGLATELLAYVLKLHGLDKLTFSGPACSQMMHFLYKRGFQKDGIYQFEMIKTL
ncbi:MAG: hypothetical protein BGO41_03705 [Clostridiales bacterium 38-18]|mgnify:CR=1 FL=1|nr:MAG: hypothetical protein BGO41_03705 [Clostridiales bacterium 38-18]